MTKAIQTRQEHYDAAKKAHDDVVAKNKTLPRAARTALPPVPEIVDPHTVTHQIDGAGVLAKAADHNHTDVRYFDSATGQATGWRRAAEKDKLDEDWAELILG